MNAMIATGLDISPVITDRFPATQWADAFAAARKGDRGKVIIDWSETE
jgi:threonine 3-dehydrogenase